MELKNNQIGKHIRYISEKNSQFLFSNVLGVAIEKEFMPSVANLIETDLTKYLVLRKGRFAFNPMHVGRDMKLPVAMYKESIPALVSPAYLTFEIESKELLPEFLELTMKTERFDHLCWFHTDASVRGGLAWEDFSKLEIPLPSINKQKKIVHQYNVLNNRINLLVRINKKVNELGEIIYKNFFIFRIKSGDSYRKYFLKDFAPIVTGKKDANVAVKNGKYHFFTCSQDILFANEYSFDADAILIAGNGDFNVKFYSGKFEAYQRTYVLIPYESSFRDLLYYAIKYSLPTATAAARGSVISFITKGILENISFYLPTDKCILKKFSDIFSKLNKVIENNNEEISLLSKQKYILLLNISKED